MQTEESALSSVLPSPLWSTIFCYPWGSSSCTCFQRFHNEEEKKSGKAYMNCVMNNSALLTVVLCLNLIIQCSRGHPGRVELSWA